MSRFDEFESKRESSSSQGPRARRHAEAAEKKEKKHPVSSEKGGLGSFKERFLAFMRKLTDPNALRRKRLPDPSHSPEGQVPLWVSDPDHYTKKLSPKQRFWRSLGTVVLHVFLVCCIVGVTALGIVVAVVYSFSDTELDERFASMDLDYSSFIYATNATTGENYIYQEIQSTSGTRVWVSDTEIPQYVKDATVAIEDKRFYTHMGVDPIRTVNAVLEYAKTKISGSNVRASGGSTLTQQVIKNMTGDDDYGITRKVKEMLQALYIERRYTKDQILEYYLNTVYFGQSANGISAAADIYFDKEVSELTVVEGAAIIAITKAPTYYNPIINPENNRERRNTVLWMMHEQGYITRDEYDEYSATELVLAVNKEGAEEDAKTEEEDGIFLYNYYTDMVIRDVLEDLKEKGYSETEANNLLYHGGLQIYSCVDADIQSYMENYFSNEENFDYYGASRDVITNDKGETEIPQVSMLVMDPDTGDIVGVIGGRGAKTRSMSLNRATSTLRQPGSSIKPLSVYGYAIENELLTLGSPIDDVPVETRASDQYKWPSNYDGTYAGLVSVKKALSWSLNTPSAWGLKTVGVTTSFDFMVNSLHFTSLVDGDKQGLGALSVGALTDGVTLREMVAAYTVFAGEGMFTHYRSYSKVVSYDGKTILDNSVEREAVFSEQTAYLMTDILMAALNTGGSSDPAKLGAIATAGKSGTTSFFKDRWFIGYTPEYLGGIWWGYDTPNTLENTHHVAMWRDVMREIHKMKGIEKATFDQPSGIVSCSVCWKSGKLPGPYCSTDPHGGCIQTFYYKEGTQPTQTCDVHHQLYVCDASGRIAHDGCPSATLKTFVDIDRSFNFAIGVADGGYVCPRLAPTDILYISETMPVYTHMVPEGQSPSYSSYGNRANCICMTHAPSATPHPYQGAAVSTDTATDTATGTQSATTTDTGTPTDTTGSDVSSATDTGNPTDSGTVDSGTTTDTAQDSDIEAGGSDASEGESSEE